MIHPLQIGPYTLPHNIIQGPLAGVSTAPFRELIWRYSRPAFTYTEMISCKTILYASTTTLKRYTQKAKQEGLVCFQLAGSDPKELALATQRVTALGADLIDLNCGCPVKKIRHKGAGSRLLADPARMHELIDTMKTHTHLPIIVKIRVQGHSYEKFNLAIADMLNLAKPNAVVVHGRHWTEHYETPCNHDDIHFFAKTLTMPVIGNGDIACTASLKKMLGTGCAGAMISRASVGQPWLIGNLLANSQHETFNAPSACEIAAIFISHIEQLALLLGSEKHAVLHARKLAKYYGRSLAKRDDFVGEVQNCSELPAFIKLCQDFFIE